VSDAGPHIEGRVIANWQLMRQLGEGAFGAVYEAQHTSIAGRRAAIKVLHPHMSFHADIKRRFVNEASAASRADHENIIQVFDGGVTADGLCYAVMELLRGEPLSHLIRREQRLDMARAINIALQVASALRAAHQLRIVHRDLKPDNIFIVRRETNAEFVKVLDFGVAKLHDPDGPATTAGMLMGTPAYMSPEQWQTLPDIDGRSDLYALGMILFECVTGGLPFIGSTPYEWLDAHLNRPPLEPIQFAAITPELNALILRMLAKSRDERPQSAGEVSEALQRARMAATPVRATQPPVAGVAALLERVQRRRTRRGCATAPGRAPCGRARRCAGRRWCGRRLSAQAETRRRAAAAGRHHAAARRARAAGGPAPDGAHRRRNLDDGAAGVRQGARARRAAAPGPGGHLRADAHGGERRRL
jgi:serine/threonine-protein kinase